MYMAPEQAGSGDALDGRADLYAAGIVLYELLTGTLPFEGASLAGVLVSHLVKPPPELPNKVPEPLRQIVARLLKKTPAERFASAEELDAALWADQVLTPDEQRLIAAFFYNQKQKIAAMMQQQQAAGGAESFSPQDQGMQGEEEPLTAGAPGAGEGDSGFEDYQP